MRCVTTAQHCWNNTVRSASGFHKAIKKLWCRALPNMLPLYAQAWVVHLHTFQTWCVLWNSLTFSLLKLGSKNQFYKVFNLVSNYQAVIIKVLRYAAVITFAAPISSLLQCLIGIWICFLKCFLFHSKCFSSHVYTNCVNHWTRVNINEFCCSLQVNQWLKMMSDASDMLAAALEQMDGIIAGQSYLN